MARRHDITSFCSISFLKTCRRNGVSSGFKLNF
jgi:hypothetical protein